MTSLRPVTDLSAHRLSRAHALQRAAAAPVLRVTPEFLDALNCRGEWAPEQQPTVGRPGLRAV